MKELLREVKGELSPYGYRKTGNSFWKVENGFYKLINFQHGAYGDYFFINVGLHPVGLPRVSGKLEIKERPREHECVIRRRIGEIVPNEWFQKALTPLHDPHTLYEITACIPAVESWLAHWGNFETLADKDFSELSGMMPIAPILWRKSYDLLKCYCMIKQKNLPEAKKYFLAYLAENKELDFSAVDRYMESLLDGLAAEG